MDNLTKIAKLLAENSEQLRNQTTNNEVWAYTRVSSKDQEHNSSIDHQKRKIKEYADENNLVVSKWFGGTYESASSDSKRKEFTKMKDELQIAKEKPFAIIVFKANRFSRTGSGAITELKQLRDQNVELIDVESGTNTMTEDGELRAAEELIQARRENYNRIQVIIPGLVTFLKDGNWLGKAPRGYDHFGKRVKDITKVRGRQELMINSEGKILREAWKWKILGYKDVEIVKKLKTLGLLIKKQRLSEMWRNPFYCGILRHKLLGSQLIEGNWEPLISQQDFITIQQLLEKGKSGYVHKKVNTDFPLKGLIKCCKCGRNLTHYEVKKKKAKYYKCNTCSGMNINLSKTPKSIRDGAHDLFALLLDQYSLDSALIPIFTKQLRMIFDERNKESKTKVIQLKKKKTNLINKKEEVMIKYGLGDIDKEVFDLTNSKLEEQIQNISKEIENCQMDLSNLTPFIDRSVQLCSQPQIMWDIADYSDKQKIQNVIFPGGIHLNENRDGYLTSEVNSIFELIRSLSDSRDRKQKGLIKFNYDKSSVVAGTGLEPVTFGL